MDITPPFPAPPISLNRRVFVNRTLNLNSIKVVGFDMDYTLVQYDEDRVEELVFELATRCLVDKFQYPEEILKLRFQPDDVIRGLVIDKRHGNLLKVNRFGYIKTARHRDQFLTKDELKTLYANETVSLTDPRYEMIHTSFSLSLASLYCQLMDKHHPGRSYDTLFVQVATAVDLAHRDGTLKRQIVARPDDFVRVDPEYAHTLLMLRGFDKKIALITNAEWEFCRAMMAYSYDPYLPKGMKWQDLFDVVVTSAAKPAFFTAENKFFEIMPDTGFLKNLSDSIECGKIYQGGNSDAIEKLFGVQSGEVLYVGDHVFTDVILSKKRVQWRTMLVITELEAELQAAHAGRSELQEIEREMLLKEELEILLDQTFKRIRLKNNQYVATTELEGLSEADDITKMDDQAVKKRQNVLRDEVKSIDIKVGKLIERYNSRFNAKWGEILFAGNDKSQFGASIERFACVHTSKVSNLLFYSPVHYFRPQIKNYF